MYKTILVPLDGSKRAEAILPHVENLATRYEAKVVLLHVEHPPLQLEYDEVIDLERHWQARVAQRKEIQAYLKSIINQLHDKNIRAQMYLAIDTGQISVVKCIIETAVSENADLVAMASHGHGGLARVFYGGVTAGVLQQIDRPLLLIRSRYVQ